MKNEISSYLENISLLIAALVLFLFPLFITNMTTDPYSIPKQALLGLAAIILLLLFAGKMMSDGNVRIRRTPIDTGLLLFGVALLISAAVSVNRIDSLIAFVPLLFALVIYYMVVNVAKTESTVSFLITAAVAGATITSLFAILSFLKLYPLPFSFAKATTFTPLGSLLDQAMYLAFFLPIAGYFALPLIRDVKGIREKEIGFGIASIIILLGLCITLYQLVFVQNPLLLPFSIGFQTAFAAISQDNARLLWGFLFGSGFGTYLADFTRFKPLTINVNQALWSVSFFRSSSFILELLATTGVVGIGAFLLIVFQLMKAGTHKLQDNPLLTSVLLVLAATLILPFSFISQTALFFILALAMAVQGLRDHKNFFDIDLRFVAFRNGINPFETNLAGQGHGHTTKILPVTLFVLFLLVSGVVGFYTVYYVISDVMFQRSLVAASSNNGLQTYNNQISAINFFPYRDAYYRIYSQTNLVLANSLAAQQPANTKPSEQIQETITQLIQQSINAARQATTIAPLTSGNWQNLSSIYRGLIGFGENAESFAIATQQQSAVLDPNNPEQYIILGGIYYQLQQWDNAQRQFQIAITLKPDYANAYYNLGHALESKGDFQNALVQYEAVKTLTTNNPENKKKIEEEILAMQKKIGTASNAANATTQQQPASPAGGQGGPLEVNQPQTQLPETNNPVQIPGPSETVTPTPTPSGQAPTTSPSPAPAGR